jgi:hypothetical protein
MNIHFSFDTTQKIFYKQYSGEITFNDFKISWLDAIQNHLFPEETKGFLLDYRKATLLLPLNEASKISNFFIENLHVFKNKKIAFIATTPEQIVIPLMLQEFDFNYQTRPFSTIEAATDWISR